MNVMDNIRNAVNAAAYEALNNVASAICDNMRDKLTEDGHAGSGKLLDSIGYEIVTDEAGNQSAVISMADYGFFIDSGTGAAHGGVRQGSWRYQGRDGNWYTTDGMDADPFIDVSIDTALADLPENLASQIRSMIKSRGGGTT